VIAAAWRASAAVAPAAISMLSMKALVSSARPPSPA